MARTYATPTNTGAVAQAGKDFLIYLNTGETEANPTQHGHFLAASEAAT